MSVKHFIDPRHVQEPAEFLHGVASYLLPQMSLTVEIVASYFGHESVASALSGEKPHKHSEKSHTSTHFRCSTRTTKTNEACLNSFRRAI